MFLRNLQLLDFKNYTELKVEFSPQVNCLLGENGIGKTNLLDAVHHLCLSKSAFNKIDQQLVRHGAAFYMVQGEFEADDVPCKVLCSFQAGKKTLKADKKEYERMSDHIGRFPVVVMSPADTDLVCEGSEVRRKYFDSLLSQLDKRYLQALIRYGQALKHRNALLKLFSENGRMHPDQLEPFNMVLLAEGRFLAEKREACMQVFLPIFSQHYERISQQKEAVSIQYKSDCTEDGFEGAFAQSIGKDLALQRTTLGAHRDDYAFHIDGHPLKKFGSQGQQKSFVVALKLAQFDYMHQHGGKKPILLMDDIFDKLDDARIAQLLHLLGNGTFGQVFITDARPERSMRLLDGLDAQVKLFHIGTLHPRL